MVKYKKIKGGTSLEELNTFVEEVKISVPYNEDNTLVELGKNIVILLEKQNEYVKKLNKITPLTLTNYKESEYIKYKPETPYLIKFFMMQFIEKYIKLSNIYNKIKDILKPSTIIFRQNSRYLPRIYEECLYLYIIDNGIDNGNYIKIFSQ